MNAWDKLNLAKLMFIAFVAIMIFCCSGCALFIPEGTMTMEVASGN